MRFPKLYAILILTLGCFAQHSIASTPLVIDINHGIETTPHETGDVDKTISSSFVQTIEADNIQETHLDLAQIIQNSSGIKIRQIGGLGSQSLVSIRGKSSAQVMIYLDGMLLNNASGGSVDLSQIPVNQIARIEVYKDVIPVEFSEASNGGVINIITHRTNKQKSRRFSGGIGSFNTHKIDFNTADYYKKWQYVISGGYLESENDFKFNNENSTFDNPDDDETQNRHNNQLYQYNIIAKAKYNINKNQSMQYQAELFNKVKHIPSLSNNPETRTSISYDDKHFNGSYIDRQFNSNKLELNVSGKASLKTLRYDDRKRQIGLVKKLIDQEIKSVAGKIYLKYKHNNFQLVSNNSLRYENLSIDDIFEQDNSKTNKRKTFSSALQGHFYYQEKKLVISPAIRFLVSQDDFTGDTVTESGDDISLGKRFSTASPQLGLRYQLSPKTTMKFNAGKYYRLPNYIELFGTRGYIGANESLIPEQGINLDAGFEYFSYPESNRLTKLNWNFALFHSLIRDEIVYSFDARGVGKPSNNKKSSISGIENNISLEFNYDMEIISNTTLQLPLNQSDPTDTKLLAGRTIWSQTTRFIANHAQWQLFFEHVWESSYYFDGEERLPSKEKSIFNSGFNMNSKILGFSLALNNIFNQPTKDYYSQVAPGLSIILTARLKFS